MGRLLDFKGFLDRRYTVLAVGAFVAMLGQFIPYYYVGMIYPLPFFTGGFSNYFRHLYDGCGSYISSGSLSPTTYERIKLPRSDIVSLSKPIHL